MQSAISSRLLNPLLRFRTSRGFGVHSPFVFKIISELINCSYEFYSFNFLDICLRSNLKVKRMHDLLFDNIRQNQKFYRLLFRFANYFNVSTVYAPSNLSLMPIVSLITHSKNSHAYMTVLSDSDLSFLSGLGCDLSERISIVDLRSDNMESSLLFDVLYFSRYTSPDNVYSELSSCLPYVRNAVRQTLRSSHSDLF